MNKEELLEAYSQTEYIIPALEITIRIGETNSQLDTLQEKEHSTYWAFVTAENPKSMSLSDAENLQRTNEFKERLDKLGKTYFEGYGQGASDWKPEQSFLILNTTKQDAIEQFGIPFQQNAIVIGMKAKEAELCIVEEVFYES